jgi:biopolymer transport protein ExbD
MHRRFGKKKKLGEDMSLQITSMADIFTILLVFLLKSYSTSLTNLAPVSKTKLPEATVKGSEIRDTLKMEVNADAILIDEKPVVRLHHFEFGPGEVAEDGRSPAVFQVLLEQRRHLPNPNVDPNLLVMADEKTPFATIKPLLASAANAGFVDLQLVAVAPD